ncbi:MAG: polyprenyl synthetase family protein, partial [Gemmatimonadaceae bacterium]
DALAFSEDDYEFLIRAKTSALFSAACEVGALCGSSRFREPLRLYGERLGMAFQVADDLLDYTASEQMTGKPTGLDLREHKVTLPLIYALRDLPAAQRASVDELFRTAEPSDEQIARVVEVVREAGGLEYAQRRGEEFAAQAEDAISVLPDSAARTSLFDAVAYVMARRS